MKLNRSTIGYRNLCLVTFFLLLIVLTLHPLLTAQAPAADPIITSAYIPLTGSIGGITLDGQIHVLTRTQNLSPPDPCKLDIYVYIPTADVRAFDVSGNQYLAHGASNLMGITYLPNPVYPPTPVIPDMTFFLDPVEIGQGQGGRISFLVHFDLHFTPAGELMPAASSGKVSCTKDVC